MLLLLQRLLQESQVRWLEVAPELRPGLVPLLLVLVFLNQWMGVPVRSPETKT